MAQITYPDKTTGQNFTAAEATEIKTVVNGKQDVLAEGAFANGDKTKLDGIEAGADVTDTANVTAAGALMDSEVTNLTAVKAFDPADYATPGDLADYAPIASPGLTGTPTAPTAAPGTNTTQVATTAFVQAAATAGGAGTVTSVAVSGSDGIQVDSGSPVTASGTIALGVDAAALRTHINVADGATANSADATLLARANHTGMQPLASIAGIGSAAAADTLDFAPAGHTHDTLNNVATSTILGRVTAGSGLSEELTPAQVRTLLNVEDGATADQTGAEIKAAYEAEADTNAYNDAAVSKLAGIETGATADQTGAEIKAAYEAEADTNAYTDADAAKVAIAVKSDTTQGGTGSAVVQNIVLIGEAAHTALGTPDANTLYFRSGA